MSHNIFDHSPEDRRQWQILRTNARSTTGPIKRNRRKGEQPAPPIEWTREATKAFNAGYSSRRQYPGAQNYFDATVRGLHAAWAAQGLPNFLTFGPEHTVPFAQARRRPIHKYISTFDTERRQHEAIAAGLNAVLAVITGEGGAK